MKCALVGCGYWGEKVLSALCKPQESRDLGVLEPYGKGVLHSAEFELVGVYDSHLDNAQKARESCPSVHIYPSFEALLADRQIQAVFIITPPASHFALAKAALEAKKHIFVEKPLALSSKECALLYELAARQGVVVHCDHIFLYAPAVQWLKAHIHELGEICSIHARRESLGRLQKEVSVVWDLALHDIAILDYVLGAGVLEQMKPSARVVEAGGYRAVADIGLVDTRTTIAIHTSWLSPTKVREMVIVGRSGRGVVYDEVADPKLAMFAMDSALGSHSGDFKDFRGTADLKSSSPLKSLKNTASTTAIPRILEEEKGAKCEKSTENKNQLQSKKVDSSNEAFSSSLRADLSARQSIQTKTQNLESTFDTNAKNIQTLQNEDSSPNAHFSVIASRDSGVAIHKGAKVDSSNAADFTTAKNKDSSKDYSASAECMDSKETSANAERYPLFSKEATLCHATATQCLAMTENNAPNKKVDSSKQAKNVSKQPKDSRIFTQNAPSVSDSQAAGFSKKTSANAKFCDNNAKAENVFDSHAAGGRIVDTNAELQKVDSRICDEKPLLCKPRKEIRLERLSTKRGAAIKGLSRKAESQKPMPLDSMSIFAYATNKTLKLICYISDEAKDGAKELVAYLQSNGKKVVLLSGDRAGAVEAVASSLGIREFHSGLLPDQKAQYIQDLQESLSTPRGKGLWRKDPSVVMIGDGLNDIVALKTADVGVSMGAGSDIAIAQSDVIVLDDSLASLQAGFVIARETYARIYQNLAISLAYNALLIPLALCGFVIPLVAALSMSLSSLLVVGNSLRKSSSKGGDFIDTHKP